jgi:LuxR family transcriptional regulator of csgAB operon
MLDGELWLHRATLARYILAKHTLNGGISSDSFKVRERKSLTHREIQIVSLLASGAGSKDIADILAISDNTVRSHLYNIFRKINVSNSVQAANWGVNNL